MLNLHLLAVLSVLYFVTSAVALLADAPVAPLSLPGVPLRAVALVAVRIHYCVRQVLFRLGVNSCDMDCLGCVACSYWVAWRLLITHGRLLIPYRS